MSIFQQGLVLSVVGFSLTFIAIGFFAFICLILEKVFREKPSDAVIIPASLALRFPEEGVRVEKSHQSQQDSSPDLADIAAIAFAFYMKEIEAADTGLGSRLREAHGKWWNFPYP